jgi:hypothetical protein
MGGRATRREKKLMAGSPPAQADETPGGVSRGALAAFAWSIGLVAFSIYGAWANPLKWLWPTDCRGVASEANLLWLLCKHPLISAHLGAILLIVAGRLGRSLGLPGLFRTPPPADLADEMMRRRRRKGYQPSRGKLTAFWGGFGIAILTALAWSAIYFSEIFANLVRLPPQFFEPTSWRGVGVAIREPSFWNHGDLVWFFLYTGLPTLGLFLLAEAFPDASSPGLDRRGWRFIQENLDFTLGMTFGSLTVVGMTMLGARTHGPALEVWEPLYGRLSQIPVLLPNTKNTFSLFAIDNSVAGVGSVAGVAPEVLTSFGMFPVLTLLLYGIFAVPAVRRFVSPGLALCMLLGLGIVFCSVVAQLSAAGRLIAFVALAAWVVAANGGRFKYRFPGMAAYYPPNQPVPIGSVEEAGRRPAEQVGLIQNQAALTAWHEATGQDKPKLVLVATTGGAYRASFWTTVVLDELGRSLGAGFHRHIRLITGASGGIVGAAYYVSSLTEGGLPEGGSTPLLEEDSGLDSLTPVVRQLVFGDLPGVFLSTRRDHDRGVELERQWATLARTFPQLGDGERAGWRPSLVVSPMVVESGRRLLISNLDLGRLAEVRPLEEAPGSQIFSRPAIEFFRVFPEARATFSLQTAVRMSATFPFASPAVTLPVDGIRRVVDAGYYDNYGVDLATTWLHLNQDWIRDHTSGVALIQLRAYPSEAETQSFFGEPGKVKPGPIAWLLGRIVISLQGLTSPLAGVLIAREWSMRFRNATQVRAIGDLLNRGRPGFFRTFVFENSVDFAMNWFLSERDIDDMRLSIGAPLPSDDAARPSVAPTHKERDCCHSNLEAKEKLKLWWGEA